MSEGEGEKSESRTERRGDKYKIIILCFGLIK
jgi:hypothetical protein